MNTVAQSNFADGDTLVLGLGVTGWSVARHLARRGVRFGVADTRAEPPRLAAFRDAFPGVPVFLGPFDEAPLARAGEVVVSPGIAHDEPVVAAARARGVSVVGDIELFARQARAPVVAVTGSNGKSTVSTLVAQMAQAAGRDCRVGGNLGTAALDLLKEREPDLYVLELSSFQLEATHSLVPCAATVLNVSPDHLDRHSDLETYAAIKARIFSPGDGAGGVMVLNRDDPMVAAMARPGRTLRWFTLEAPADENCYGLRRGADGREWLARGDRTLLPVAELRLAGRHNYANALAALALGEAAGLPLAPLLAALRRFTGLAHRGQWVAEHAGVGFYNDSKGTNLGATLAALEGMPGERVVLIAGGEGKGQDFSPLADALRRHGRALVLIGRDAPLIEAAVGTAVPVVHAADMRAAVAAAHELARAGDTVLLSPACASFDMFENYAARGEAFVAAVREVLA